MTLSAGSFVRRLLWLGQRNDAGMKREESICLDFG